MVASISNVASAAAGTKYFENDGYYAEGSPEHRQASMWMGEGAAALKLGDYVETDQFRSILEGYVPGSDQRIGRVMNGTFVHKPGTDITFSAPKSVSMAALIGGDKRLIEAHKAAVKETMAFVEKEALVSRAKDPVTGETVRIGGQKMVAAAFTHDTSRNLDPQLHTHVVVANMSQGEDGKWRAVENNSLYQHKMLIGAVYHNALARNVTGAGYTIEAAGRNGVFELKDVYSRAQIEAFSTRSADIKAALRDMGEAKTPAIAAQAALLTRARKADIDRSAVERIFRDRAATHGVAWGDLATGKTTGMETTAPTPATSTGSILEWSIRHLEERNSVFTRRELLQVALAHSPGSYTPARFSAAMDGMVSSGRLHQADAGAREQGFTTDLALGAERQNLAMLERAEGASRAVIAAEAVDRHLEGGRLTDGQKAAVKTILASEDRIVGVQGYAGSGKTTMLAEMRGLAEAQMDGRAIIGLAPSASAARTLEQESGIESHTLQHFLAKYGAIADGRADQQRIGEARSEIRDAIIVVDEASLASTMQMKELMKISETLMPGRLVLVGDAKQLDAVDAGVPFRQLQHAGMETAVMDQIMRQRDPELKAAVIDALDGQPKEALDKLGHNIIEAPRGELGTIAAQRWLMLDTDMRERTGLMAPTHALRDEINEVVRTDLKRDGLLHGPEAMIERLDPLRHTVAEKELAGTYLPGHVVIFERELRAAGIEAGTTYRVIGRDDGQVLLADDEGHQRSFDPAGGIADRLESYEPADMELRAGDRIRWTRNDRELELVNTHQAEVTGIASGMVQLTTEDGRELALPADAPQLRHSDYAFNATVHAFQGRTADQVIAVLDASHQELTNEKTFYVEISRARDRAIIVTDDRMQLAETLAANSGEAVSALQGIGAEPMTTRGMATEAQMADTIQSARDDSSMSLEEREAEWNEMPPIETDREYGVDADMAASLAVEQVDAAPHQGVEKSRGAEMEM